MLGTVANGQVMYYRWFIQMRQLSHIIHHVKLGWVHREHLLRRDCTRLRNLLFSNTMSITFLCDSSTNFTNPFSNSTSTRLFPCSLTTCAGRYAFWSSWIHTQRFSLNRAWATASCTPSRRGRINTLVPWLWINDPPPKPLPLFLRSCKGDGLAVVIIIGNKWKGEEEKSVIHLWRKKKIHLIFRKLLVNIRKRKYASHRKCVRHFFFVFWV